MIDDLRIESTPLLNIFMIEKGREDKQLSETLYFALIHLCCSKVFLRNSGRSAIILYNRPPYQAGRPPILYGSGIFTAEQSRSWGQNRKFSSCKQSMFW